MYLSLRLQRLHKWDGKLERGGASCAEWRLLSVQLLLGGKEPSSCHHCCLCPADPKSGKKKRGVCSNYLYHVQAGDELRMTGPCGTVLLLPEDHFKRPIVCVCTGQCRALVGAVLRDAVGDPVVVLGWSRGLANALSWRCCRHRHRPLPQLLAPPLL